MSSTVPAVLAALQSVVGAALPGVQVIYGPPLSNLEADYVALAWAGGGNPAVAVAGDHADLRGESDTESVDVASQIVSWRGSAEEFPTAVARAYELFDLIFAAISGDPELGVPGATATVADHSFEPVQSDQGPVAVLTFTVHVDAWRQ